ncbi:MAG: VOC family protein [Woeseiaceae bacterium]|nr:VOC family protein [Woeseiaceae bacterium]
MYLGIHNIDHPVIASRDLDVTRAQFERLGFTVPPRGSHIEWGTGNLCVMFPDDYVEVRGIVDPERFTMHLDEHLEQHGEGLMGVAFGTADVKASYAEAVEHGIKTGELRNLRRNFEHPEGWTQPAFELYAPDADDIEGLMHVVVIEHLTPELIRRPDFLEHANGCLGINEMRGAIDDVERVAGKMRRLLGDAAVTEGSEGIVLTVPSGQRIRLDKADTTGLASMTMRVADLDRTERLFISNDVAFVRDGETITVAPHDACGTTLHFTEAGPG